MRPRINLYRVELINTNNNSHFLYNNFNTSIDAHTPCRNCREFGVMELTLFEIGVVVAGGGGFCNTSLPSTNAIRSDPANSLWAKKVSWLHVY